MLIFSQTAFALGAFALASIATANPETALPYALVSSASAAWVSSQPTALPNAPFSVDAGIAQACLQSVPIVKENATAVLDGLEAFWQFHSTTAWLKDPPSTYPVPGVDIYAELSSIRENVTTGAISGEYQFQLALRHLINQVADGHFEYKMDLLNVFRFNHMDIGPVAAVSADGISLPLSYYTFNDLRTTPASERSSVVSIDGQPAANYFEFLRQSALFADADAQLAYVFGDVASIGNAQFSGIFADGTAGVFFGNSTTLEFANGTVTTYNNTATSTADFSNVDSGLMFYEAFCTGPVAASNATIPDTRTLYPSTNFVDETGSIAGYFLNDTNSDTAVLSIQTFATGATPARSAQTALRTFLEACRIASKSNLIIDLSSNNGGNSLLTFDFFKQYLFPIITPYNVQVARAQPAYEFLGAAISNVTALARSAGHDTQATALGGYTAFDAAGSTQPNGSNINWQELYGPEYYHGDNFTNLFGRKFFDPEYSEVAGNIVVSGYGNRSRLQPQPFKSENIVMMINGACDSGCALFAHFLKWQGKVKSIAIGGRPQEGPMQAVGGTRGTQDEPFNNIYMPTAGAAEQATPEQLAQAKETALGPILKWGKYVLGRAIQGPILNLYNHIAQDDRTLTPLQFTYEAADCRIFYTAETAVDVAASWSKVADVWKSGLVHCVSGSTGQPTSLTGNVTLYDSGTPANVSMSEVPQDVPSLKETAVSTSAASASASRFGSMPWSWAASIVAALSLHLG